MQDVDGDLLPVLKQQFGFSSFKPLQEQIITDSLAGRDVFALLPTGGGKSLCFQLPALVRPGMTVVVSPLIALMKDQVDALEAAGIPATFVNSSLDPEEINRRMRGVAAGRYRLLYVAPERVVLPNFLAAVQGCDVGLIAIDEAHCISEWGHDFRPEYRQLAALRENFPLAGVMALTATATERVRVDILQHLRLREPAVHVGSFNRENLTYRVVPKTGGYAQLLAFLRERRDDSGIVYCLARRTAETLAERLAANGIKARPYHAGLTSAERSRHQEAFIRDEAPVVCATIAFGMGIDKPNVRFVVHYDLPRSVEGYYQETGRAGRDGLPSECLLLFTSGDVVRYDRFIDEKDDPKQREIAREQLEHMAGYAESATCRRRQLLDYFGERYEEENCGACDNCQTPRTTFDGTAIARKFLGALYRIREKSGFGVGVNHVADVLAGKNVEKVRRLGHDTLAAYGGGKERTKNEWVAIGRQLLHQGHMRQAGEFRELEITPKGHEAMVGRAAVTLAALEVPERSERQRVERDDALFERLRELRKRLADERDVPAYVIFSDVALVHMARDYPTGAAEFRRISGVGEHKLREFGDAFMAEIREHLRSNERQTFASEAVAAPRKIGDSHWESLRRYRAGESAEAIAADRGFLVGTILGHLGQAAEAGEEIDIGRLLSEDEQREIGATFEEVGWENLTGVREALGERYDYGMLRLYRGVRRPKATAGAPASAPATLGRTPESPPRSPGLAHALA